MMYMPDAIKASIDLMEANPDKLIHRNSFNVTAMSFERNAFNEIRSTFLIKIEYRYDELRQNIADSWLTIWMIVPPVKSGTGNPNMTYKR